VFEKRVLRIFGPQRNEMIGRRKLHNEELHNMYSLARIIRMNISMSTRLAGNIECLGEYGNSGRKYNIKTNLSEREVVVV
jgi:hypothetical protein